MSKVRCLDPFVRPIFAPLGIHFPFPFHCSLLDTYMKSEADISAILIKYGQPSGEHFIGISLSLV